MAKTLLQQYWEQEYENTDTQFDVDRPDRWVFEREKQGKIRGNVLDAGCGPGRTALYLARLGYQVVGSDIAQNAIARAKANADKEQIQVEFVQADMTSFSFYYNHFDTVIDIGCFHSLPTRQDQHAYAQALHKATKAGAQLYLRAFSDKNLDNKQHPKGVPAISAEEITAAFSAAHGWHCQNLKERQLELLVANKQRKSGYCWFAELSKI